MNRAAKRSMMAEVLNTLANDAIFPPKNVGFVFLWWEEMDYGIFVTSDFYEFLELFHDAKWNAKNWGEFLTKIGDFGRRFVTIFTEADTFVPKNDDLIENIQDELFVLSDDEFPITQCADETYNNYIDILPPLGGGRAIRTEYDMQIGLYLKSDFLIMKEHMDKMGFSLNSKLSPFFPDLYNY